MKISDVNSSSTFLLFNSKRPPLTYKQKVEIKLNEIREKEIEFSKT